MLETEVFVKCLASRSFRGSLPVVAGEVWAGQGGGCQHRFPLCPSAWETAAGPVLKHSFVILSFLWPWRAWPLQGIMCVGARVRRSGEQTQDFGLLSLLAAVLGKEPLWQWTSAGVCKELETALSCCPERPNMVRKDMVWKMKPFCKFVLCSEQNYLIISN